MILAVLGTHPQPMRRLITGLSLYHEHHPSEPICVQAANVEDHATNLQMVGVIPEPRLHELIRSARVVVTHGGPGTILACLSEHRRPIVLPRDPQHSEHVDDHQIRFVRWLASRAPIVAVSNVDELLELIDGGFSSKMSDADVGQGTAVPRKVITRLREIMDE